jgi:hypothetical protein
LLRTKRPKKNITSAENVIAIGRLDEKVLHVSTPR